MTDHERQILNGIAAGRSNPEVAAELFVSVNTIRFHVTNVLGSLLPFLRSALQCSHPRTAGRIDRYESFCTETDIRVSYGVGHPIRGVIDTS
ncbi:helix-turn-helix transcriptional regulator [Rhodococcus pseudokoreensis]|uniref:Helix-turn-helix transcriptional regulator n=1 Tax=Rhodococcus pseudokoreensis TaxID=2811421 RepID=A0A974W6T2_9NOCA|nr:helix-turn-helix transcriptional regulator [Rhodococcus pseudokoreensis]